MNKWPPLDLSLNNDKDDWNKKTNKKNPRKLSFWAEFKITEA